MNHGTILAASAFSSAAPVSFCDTGDVSVGREALQKATAALPEI